MIAYSLHCRTVFSGAALLISVLVWNSRAADPGSIKPRTKATRAGDIHVDSNLVLIPISVTDPGNHPVIGLAANQFRVFEGKIEQTVLRLSSDDAPLSVGIIFDASGSMAAKLPKARDAVAEFLKTANPEDEFFLVNFARTPELVVPFTNNPGDIQMRLMYAGTRGKTALLDALSLAIHYLKNARNPRRALLVISDGGDNHSRYNQTEILRMVQESDVSIYALGIYDRGIPILPEEERGGEKLLTDIAEESGGRQFAVDHPSQLPAAAAAIGLELRNQYLLAYRPSPIEANGKYRRVQVKLVEQRGMRLSWRPGYYAPAP